MSSNRRKLLKNTVSVNIGCSCRRSKLSNIFWPKSKTKSPKTFYPNPHLDQSSSTSLGAIDEEDHSNITFSPKFDSSTPLFSEPEDYLKNPKTVQGFGRIGESVAVVKDSDDPYLDFRRSMLQMILENEIYSRDDLQQLLDCFLSLNSPYHHEVIVRVFTEIWNGVFYSSKQPRIRRKSREF